jgi:hypothetical protein
MSSSLVTKRKRSAGNDTELSLVQFFGIGSADALGLKEGWAWPEENHIWNDGYEATLNISLPAVPNAVYKLIFEARPHLAPGLERQDVTLYFNGHRVGFWRLEESGGVTLEADIEPEFWFKRQGVAVGKCTWHLPNSTKPSDIKETQDNRLLGLCFQSMMIARKNPNPDNELAG